MLDGAAESSAARFTHHTPSELLVYCSPTAAPLLAGPSRRGLRSPARLKRSIHGGDTSTSQGSPCPTVAAPPQGGAGTGRRGSSADDMPGPPDETPSPGQDREKTPCKPVLLPLREDPGPPEGYQKQQEQGHADQ